MTKKTKDDLAYEAGKTGGIAGTLLGGTGTPATMIAVKVAILKGATAGATFGPAGLLLGAAIGGLTVGVSGYFLTYNLSYNAMAEHEGPPTEENKTSAEETRQNTANFVTTTEHIHQQQITLKTAFDIQTVNLKKAEADIAKLTQVIIQLKAEKKAKDTNINSLEQQLTEIQHEYEKIKKENQTLRYQRNSILQDGRLLLRENVELQTEQQKLETEVQRLKAKIQTLETEIQITTQNSPSPLPRAGFFAFQEEASTSHAASAKTNSNPTQSTFH